MCQKKLFLLRSDVWSFGILMFEVLTIGENPYIHHKIRNKDYKERMKVEYEWVIENVNRGGREANICRAYSDTRNKPWDADILRCGEPDNIPDFRVNREAFEAVIKVWWSKENPVF